MIPMMEGKQMNFPKESCSFPGLVQCESEEFENDP